MSNFHTLTQLNTMRVRRLKIQDSGANTVVVNASVIAQKGSGSISGIVTEVGVPVSRRVMLYERSSGLFFGQTQSSITGTFTFDNTKEDLTYFVVSLDENQEGIQYNLAGQDLLSGDFDNARSV